MSDDKSSDAIGDIVNLLAAPLAGGLRVVDQAWRGTEELIRTIEKLNRTLDSLNETSQRVNSLLEDFEEPVRAAIPQLVRTIRTADELTRLLDGPIRSAAPNIERLSAGLSQPGIAALPDQLGEAVGLLRDMAARMAPLTTLAEGAGGLFAALGRAPGGSTGSKKATADDGAASGADQPIDVSSVDDADGAGASPTGGPKKATAKKSQAAPKGSSKTTKKASKGAKKPTPKPTELKT